MIRPKLGPLIMVALFALCGYVGWRAHVMNEKEAAFIQDVQQELRGELAGGTVAGLWATADTLFLDAAVELRDDRALQEQLVRQWVKPFSDLRQKALGRRDVTVVLMQSTLPLIHAVSKDGEEIEIREGAP